MWPSASITLYARAMSRLLQSVIDPILFEPGETIALARHLQPTREQPCRREQQAIAQVGRVVAVFLERRARAAARQGLGLKDRNRHPRSRSPSSAVCFRAPRH